MDLPNGNQYSRESLESGKHGMLGDADPGITPLHISNPIVKLLPPVSPSSQAWQATTVAPSTRVNVDMIIHKSKIEARALAGSSVLQDRSDGLMPVQKRKSYLERTTSPPSHAVSSLASKNNRVVAGSEIDNMGYLSNQYLGPTLIEQPVQPVGTISKCSNAQPTSFKV